jgi:hypothetical protein
MAEAFLPSDRRFDAPSLYEEAMYGYPWTDGYRVVMAVHQDEVSWHYSWTAEYGPTSPRTGQAVSYEKALEEYELSREAGGLWDFDSEAETAARAAHPRLLMQRARAAALPAIAPIIPLPKPKLTARAPRRYERPPQKLSARKGLRMRGVMKSA